MKKVSISGPAAVHQGKLELVFEIGKSTQTPDDDAALLPPHEIDEQSFKGLHPYVREVARRLSGHCLSFVNTKSGSFLRIVENRHAKVVEERRMPFPRCRCARSLSGRKIPDRPL